MNWRKKLYRIHGWLGLHLGLLLFIICFSGTIAVFTPELDALLDPVQRVQPTEEAEKISLGRTLEVVRKQYPTATVRYLTRSENSKDPDMVLILYSREDVRRIFVDPYRAEVLGERPALDLKSFVRVFHKQLNLVPTGIGFHGVYIVGSFGLVMLAAAVTGILAFKNWFRSLYTLRIKAKRRLFVSDLHRLLGAWALLVTLILAVTGLYYLVEKISERTGLLEHDPAAPRLSQEVMESKGLNLRPLPLDEILAKVKQAYPKLRPTAVFLPSSLDTTLVVIGQAEAFSVRSSANSIALDPYNGDVVQLQRGTELGLVDRTVHTMDPVHFGTFGGLLTRWIWFVCGLALSVSILVGAYIYYLRVIRRTRNSDLKAKRYVGSLSGFVTSVVLLATLLSTVGFHKKVIFEKHPSTLQRFAGSVTSNLYSPGVFLIGASPQEQQSVALRFSEGVYPNFSQATFLYEREGQLHESTALWGGDHLFGSIPVSMSSPFESRLLSVRLHLVDQNRVVTLSPSEMSHLTDVDIPPRQEIAGMTYAGIGLFCVFLIVPSLGWLIYLRC